uniref:bifunctional hydroxymethylpyrimidine kinase/phosphomethylpyrimidine kinase n=1 Tax=Candidatus Vallotiella hemipterorum TaxID=1177213 RepID=UPI00272F0B83|nr:bifunctional hydroxymethylpyrimidine kinase/phosphomethylpyrimidine kinase [Candidatus Vallotia tarda]
MAKAYLWYGVYIILNVLTIAGSDPSGGAGIQADLKTFSALGVYGATAITALTAQNTQGVTALYPVADYIVAAQLDAVFRDLRIDAVKIGMLANVENVLAVSSVIERYKPAHVVLDTVICSSNGYLLLEPCALAALRDRLLPLASIITPNLHEASVLLGEPVAADEVQMIYQGDALRALGAQAVLIKGGHLLGNCSPDWLIEKSGHTRISSVRLKVIGTHGTGCTLSAAIAALRPQNRDWTNAVNNAKIYINQALLQSTRLSVGLGTGPLHHFHAWW